MIPAMQESSVTPAPRHYLPPPAVLPSLGGLAPWGRGVVGHHQGQASANELWRERVAEKHGVKQGLKCVMVL